MNARGNGRIYERKTSAFLWCAYFLRGKEYRESTRTADPKKAAKFLRQRMDQVGADRAGKGTFVGPEQQRVKVSELLDELEKSFKTDDKDTPVFRSQLRHIRDYFGDILACSVTPEGVDAFIVARREAGYKNATINRWTQLLGQAYNLAIERRHLTSAPMIKHLSEKGNERKGFFSDAEFSAVENRLPENLRDFCRFAYTTGWRKGEVSALRWEDVDGDVIRLRGEDAKNDEGRSVVLTGDLAKLIGRRKSVRQVETESGVMLAEYVFHNDDGSAIKSIRKSWWSACCGAGVGRFTCPKCNQSGAAHRCPQCEVDTSYSGKLFHDLRRTGVRNMVRAGVNQHTAMAISGHKTPSMFKRYNIQSEDDLRNAMKLTQAYLKANAEKQPIPIPIRKAAGSKN